jgi:hypothetical protein
MIDLKHSMVEPVQLIRKPVFNTPQKNRIFVNNSATLIARKLSETDSAWRAGL